MQNIVKSIFKRINEQNAFIKASIYIMGGFSIVLAGYGVGRLVGLITF